ncbi:hypothetical protein Ancab_017161 [Ancistrocladus abbreviatus]
MAMACMEEDTEVVKSPFTRLYRHRKPEEIINCAMGFKYPLDVEAVKAAISASLMVQHPRFSSLYLRDHCGRDRWKRVPLNIDDHIIVHHHHHLNNTTANANTTTTNASTTTSTEDSDQEAIINAYLADFALSSLLREDRPLWELHFLVGLNCVILRVHHVVGDGLSLMAMLSACFESKRKVDKAGNITEHQQQQQKQKHRQREWRDKGMWGLMKSIWFTIIFMAEVPARILGVKDKRTVISGGNGVELWPRKLVTVKFKLEDINSIKKAVPRAYLNVQSPKALQDNLKLTCALMVNLRKDFRLQEVSSLMKSGGRSPWGNKISVFLLPIHYCKGSLSPLEHVRRMRKIMNQKKQSFEAHMLSNSISLSNSLLGPTVGNWLYNRIGSSLTLSVSNIIGPQEEIVIAGNPVTYVRVSVCGSPQAITLHLVSYAGRADLQVLVAKDIIHNPEFLGDCFKESLLEMKNAVRSPSNIEKDR